MTTFLLVRHGATDWNDRRLAQGHADIPMNARGRRQAADAARALEDRRVDAVYASDLRRAIDTAVEIARPRGLDVVTDASLREIDQGEWEGVHVDEIRRRWPELWGPARHFRARPGGEAPGEVRTRAVAALERIARAHPDGTVAVVSHGGTMRWIVAEALGLDDDDSGRLRGVANGGIVELDAAVRDGRLVFEEVVRHDGATAEMDDDPNR